MTVGRPPSPIAPPVRSRADQRRSSHRRPRWIVIALAAIALVALGWFVTRPPAGPAPIAGTGIAPTATTGALVDEPGAGGSGGPTGARGGLPAASAGRTAGPTAGQTTAAGSPVATPRSSAGSGGSPPPAAPTTNPGGSVPAPAPTSAAGFKPRATIVPILFPLRATASYRYGDRWRVPRLGVVYPYNQIHGVGPGSALLRAHDGVDLEVRVGTPVLAPFAGVVVDPRAVWKPWDPARYGTVVAIRSGEATSRGYYAILVHLSVQSVKIGQVVKRGQVVGTTGNTGNADGTIPHLHFELRTPFPIEFHYAGVTRALDSFDPLPSLLAADPKP